VIGATRSCQHSSGNNRRRSPFSDAIKNAHLLSEVRESLHQQTSTADVLRVTHADQMRLREASLNLMSNANKFTER
jgi:hypothetical protein